MASPADISNNTKALIANTREVRSLNAGISALNTNLVALVEELRKADISKETQDG